MFVPGACGCCADGCECEQLDVSACPDSFSVTFTSIGVFDPECTQEFTFAADKTDLNADGTNDGWSGYYADISGSFEFVSIAISCSGGRWVLSIVSALYPSACPTSQSISVDVGSACECPQTGTYDIVDAFGNPSSVVLA